MNKKLLAAGALALTMTLGGGAALAGQANAAAADTAGGTQQSFTSTDTSAKGTMKKRGGAQKLDHAAIASLLGMTEEELRTAQREGKTLATLAGEQSIVVQSVIDLVSEQLTANLDAKLAEGRLTQDEYSMEKAEVSTKAAELVNRVPGGKGGFGGRGGTHLDKEGIASLLGVTADELKTGLRAGKSLATLADENGVSQQSVVDLVTSELTAALDKRLADGKITQTEYDSRKAGLADQALEIVNGTQPDKGGRQGHESQPNPDEAQTEAQAQTTES
ncbi:hypothetical protein LBW89_03955 [Paenibacillus sp. alder61]|uniref:SHOCT domain-containing protein n=1 Tax=Paenibacillus faecis TaxID=862114 RepID=A0A5D0CN10_9BACL|nr:MULTISPECIES: hypothetical protein [Paenibacillus]MCA1292171.1 hypothetical protein [Paenibacillus sp. alder61]TYA11296.1 hypothetical protein FRY98_19225 [Paenibacillus faecis]